MDKTVKYRGLKYVAAAADKEKLAAKIDHALETIREATSSIRLARAQILNAYNQGKSETWSPSWSEQFSQKSADALAAIADSVKAANWMSGALKFRPKDKK